MTSAPAPRRAVIVQFIFLALLLLAGGYFRFTGLMWGDYEYQHPDERFLVWVVADISPVESAADYFNTAASTLNPVNRGHTFFVYGDFPVILTRYVAEQAFPQVGWMEILQVGRGLSAILDLLTVLLVYLLAERISGWKVATLAGLFSAAAVLQIQQAHFFTSDSFAVFFTTLAIYAGVLIATEPQTAAPRRILWLSLLYGAAVGMAMACKINTAPVAVLLPAALGVRWLRAYAASRQESSIPTGGADDTRGEALRAEALRLALSAVAAGALALLVFRLAMPYAFSGPGFFDITPDTRFVNNIKELSAQSAGDVDFPPALQWARRDHLFSLKNLVLYGLGLPLGLLAWTGFFLVLAHALQRFFYKPSPQLSSSASRERHAGRNIIFTSSPQPIDSPGEESHVVDSSLLPGGRLGGGSNTTLPDPTSTNNPAVEFANPDSSPHSGGRLGGGSAIIYPFPTNALTRLLTPSFSGALLVFLWTAAYFTWQSMSWNPTMRYQLPIYPTLAFLAAWGAGFLWHHKPVRALRFSTWRTGVGLVTALVLLLTLGWAYAFTRMYNRTETRLAASQWIFDNVPGPVNLEGQEGGTPWKQLLPVVRAVILQPGEPYQMQFDCGQAGVVTVINLPQTRVTNQGTSPLRLAAAISDPARPGESLGAGEIVLPGNGSLDQLQVPISAPAPLEAGRRYLLALTLERGDPNDTTPAKLVQIDGQITLSQYARVQSISYAGANGGMATVTLPDGGTLRQVTFETSIVTNTATVLVQDPQTGEQQLAIASPLPDSSLPVLRLDPPLTFKPGQAYLVALGGSVPGQPLAGNAAARLDFLDDPASQWLPGLAQMATPADPLLLVFNADQSGTLSKITLAHAAQQVPGAASSATLEIYNGRNPSTPAASARFEIPPANDPRGGPLTITLNRPVELIIHESYNLRLVPDAGAVSIQGSAPANESTWDMGLPFRVRGYDPYGGIYRGDLNFEMYWDDNTDKLQRFENILDQADYIFISSNRQWGTTTRVPERYPLTTAYYRDLLGCPAERDLLWCYNVAEAGTFQGRLGFDLVKVVTSYPNLGPLEINTQFAEEAFTVYDHPKVFIFQKRADYDPARTRALLGAVDLRNVVHLTPKKAFGWKDLLLPAQSWLVQQAGGTWAKLFPPEGLLNRIPWLGAAAWYLFLMLLGGLTYPIVRLALPGLPDRGYPLARTAGLVIFAYLAWILGSLGVPVTRGLLLGLILALGAAGIITGYLQREGLREEWRSGRRYFLSVEAVALALFAIDLLIRLGNPDLWHPIFGGEKPMDFSYFNAVLKSSLFPPYDPWFAGGYINYYYYGFVLVGMPVKLLGINPTMAYNLVLPALFMIVGLGAFSVGTNLKASVGGAGNAEFHLTARGERGASARPAFSGSGLAGLRPPSGAFWAGVAATVALLILGNLGAVRMYWQGTQKLVVPEEQMASGTLIQHISWAAQGAGKLISGEAQGLPYYPGDWYWKPSRAIQPESGNEITEFPMFTFLYADLHAHLIALPVTILLVAWGLGVLLGKGRWGLAGGQHAALSFGLALVLGALSAGMLRPANTWDQYTYLALAALALFFGQFWRARVRGDAPGQPWNRLRQMPGNRWVRAAGSVLLLVGLALLLYRPFDAWFQQGYNSLETWKGARTGLPSYLWHWGLFLFVITGWLVEESIDWMAATPLSALGRLRAYREWLVAGGVALAVGILALVVIGVHVALVAAPLGVWVALLLFRPGMPPAKRAVLFMTGTAMALTLAVELVAVKGDIGRMNTVFKFYYQAWTLLSLSAAGALAWLWDRLEGWIPGWRNAWLVGLGLLVFGAGLFPLTAGRAKILDRMVADAPHTLDGMEYMNHARYTDGLTTETSREMDLSADFRAIHWAQANIPGSPVIVEANTPEYRHWGTRFTIYTGLPGVVGWNWHQRQQRTVTPDTWVYSRIDDIRDFYTTTSEQQAATFLKRYNVQYIILGQIERIWYPGPGLDKFEQLNGTLWEKVYQEGETVIYKVK